MKISLNNKKINKIFPRLFDNKVNSTESFFCGHIGPSMNPTLTAQDILKIKPFHNEKPQVGDVILFKSPENEHYVVHRIVTTGINGIQTRGDNNYNIDPDFLKQDAICGRVIAAYKGDKHRKISGGFWGRLTGLSCVVRRQTNRLAVKLLGPVYRSLCTEGILHWLVPVRLTPQIVTFRSDTSNSYKLLLGKNIIGSYDQSLLQWQIRRPYRLLIDETTLPTPR